MLVFFLAVTPCSQVLCTPLATCLVTVRAILEKCQAAAVFHPRLGWCFALGSLYPKLLFLLPVSLCMLDYFAGVEARGNNMRTNVGNISSDIPKWHMNTSISRLRANLEGDKTSIIVKETLVLPKAMLYLINILKQYLYSITLSLFLTFLVFLESGARNNFLALKVKSWIFKVVNPICVWLRGLWRYLI